MAQVFANLLIQDRNKGEHLLCVNPGDLRDI